MIREEITINGRTFIKTTPADGYELVKVGTEEHYGEAIDLPMSNFEYYEVALPQDAIENYEQVDEPIEEGREYEVSAEENIEP